MNQERYRITTVDNPYNPFTEWSDWLLYDINMGYNTCERLARLAYSSEQLPDEVNELQTEAAIDELIDIGAINRTGLIVKYKKIENPNYNKKVVEEGNAPQN